MKEEKKANNASLFTRSAEVLDSDPLEEIFALNLGDFLSEHLISDELAEKIAKHPVDKVQSLKNQLKELISIYSINNTLKVLGFNNKEDYIIYNSIAKTVKQMLDIDACHIYLSKENAKGLDKTEKEIVLVGSSLNFSDDIYAYDIGAKYSDNSLVSKAFQAKKSIEITDFSKGDFLSVPKLEEDKVEYYAAIPMHNNAETVGVIVLQNYNDRKLSSEFIELIEVTARLFATSMVLQKLTEETSNLVNQEDVSLKELQHARAELTAIIGDLGDEQQQFVENLAKAVDAKSSFNLHHSEMVAELADEISAYLGLNEKTKDLIYYAALLRNIGKIILPKEIFSKKEKLSKEDWEKLQNHPNVGVNLLMSINFLSEVIPYVHYHKERWDGKGEPEGLSGYSIPLGSRIVAIADAFCALVSKRSFREAMPVDKALEIIKEESQIKWDPVLVDALVHIKS